MESGSIQQKSNNDENDRAEHYYHPAGIPITPQARRLGYEFPVHASRNVWATAVLWNGPSRLDTNVDLRIVELIQYCYDGMIKKLATQDDFIMYYFKAWHWDRYSSSKTKKKKRARYAARLFINPKDDTPWLYIFDPKRDTGAELEKGDPPDVNAIRENPEADRAQ